MKMINNKRVSGACKALILTTHRGIICLTSVYQHYFSYLQEVNLPNRPH